MLDCTKMTLKLQVCDAQSVFTLSWMRRLIHFNLDMLVGLLDYWTDDCNAVSIQKGFFSYFGYKQLVFDNHKPMTRIS